MRLSIFISLLGLALFAQPRFVFAGDNITNNFTIRDVFNTHEILVTSGLYDVYIKTDGNCTFESSDRREAITIDASLPTIYGPYDFLPMIDDVIHFKHQSCTVDFAYEDINFMAFTVKNRTADTVTGTTADGGKYTLSFGSTCNYEMFRLDDTVYVSSYIDNYPGINDRLYIFGLPYTPYVYESCPIDNTQIDRMATTPPSTELVIRGATLASKPKAKNLRRDYLTVRNETRGIVSTLGWTVENSLGATSRLPLTTLKINEDLIIHSGTGTDVTDSIGEKKVYLQRHKTSMFNKKADWIKVKDVDGNVIATYYTHL